MKRIVQFALLAVLVGGLIGCRSVATTPSHPAKKYSSAELKAELTLLKNILEANHPSLYWYTPKDSVDGYFTMTHASLQDSLTEQAFRNKVAWVISKIRCGHTVVRTSKSSARQVNDQQTAYFPLSLKIWRDSAVVINPLDRRDSIFRRGTIITSINNKPIQAVIDSMCQFISTDGYSMNFKYQVISFNFPAYYRNTFGIDSQYRISYIDTAGIRKEVVVKAYKAANDSITKRAVAAITNKEFRNYKKLSKRSLQIDSSLRTAILSINTFSEGNLRRFFRKSFKHIRKDSLQNVVLDLRQNSGGSVLASTTLSQYLADRPFKLADTVAAISRSFPYKRHIKPWFVYWLSMQFTGRRMSDDRIHFRYFERHYFKPRKRNHFKGNIYVLTGGYTFSAATVVTGILKDQKNVVVVGEETGGGAYGNTAMHLPAIVLPTTGVRVTLPLYRMVLNSSLPKNGRGVLPDVEVPPNSYIIKKGIDAKLQAVRQLIIARQATANQPPQASHQEK